MDRAVCPACGQALHAPGQRFCAGCGAALADRCPGCGAALVSGEQRFCAECGAPLAGVARPAALPIASAAPPGAPSPPTDGDGPPAPERHLVSVLFVDLVGFTPLAEGRDPEDVRELLSGYFDLARRTVVRHGGQVEKFIGDAVMAVWGAERATEDQAGRAVRAALEIVGAVPAYGDGRGLAALAARAAVGSGAVATWAAAGEGLVTGDLVNTAARIQAVGGPGQVLTDTATRDAARASIAFVDAGAHVLKGKAEPQALFRALRVVSGLGGPEDADLAIPMVGRARELAALKELYHATAEERRARLVALLGPPGVGKTRLATELGAYLDGLSATVLWHTGRCLAYGEGVAFYALAQAVRGRLGLLERDDGAAIAAKLEAGLAEHVPELSEQAWVGPALAVLLGLPTARELARDELFAGWRLFFERLAASAPVVVWVDDAQWADPGLLEFIDYLLDWAGEHPLLLVLSARPELLERRPDLSSRRGVTPIWVEPLPAAALTELIDTLVPGCTPGLRQALQDRAEGIPLFVIELLRALSDQGFLRATAGAAYAVVREPDALALPASLSTLLAARLDALGPDERQLATALSVYAGAFPAAAAAAIAARPADQVQRLLTQLVRKEILALRGDRLSPERGQYAFAQQVFRQVAYDLLTRAERKRCHLAAAAHLEATFTGAGAEVAEAVATHRLRAFEAAHGDPDEAQLGEAAEEAFARAAQRAAEVGAPEAALAASEQALRLATSPDAVARHAEAAGESAGQLGDPARAIELFDQAAAVHRAGGRELDVARLQALSASSLTRLGRPDEAIDRLGPVLASLGGAGFEARAVRATVQANLGGALVFAGRATEAGPVLETALAEGAALQLPKVLSNAANCKAILLSNQARIREAEAYYRLAAETADAAGLPRNALVVRNNLAEEALAWDVGSGTDQARACLAEARRLGARDLEGSMIKLLGLNRLLAGAADECAALVAEAAARPAFADPTGPLALAVRSCEVVLAAWRGEPERCRRALSRMEPERTTTHAERRLSFLGDEVSTLLAEDRAEAALAVAVGALGEAVAQFGLGNIITRQLLPDAVEAALVSGDPKRAQQLLAPAGTEAPGLVPPYLRAHADRLRARVAASRGEVEAASSGFQAAAERFAGLACPYWLARTRLDHAEWLASVGRSAEAEPLAAAAATVLTPFGARRWAARALAITGAGPALVPDRVGEAAAGRG